MAEIIRQHPVLFIAAAVALIAISAIITTVAIRTSKKSNRRASERDIFLHAPAVKIDDAPQKKEKPHKKEADFAWLKK